MVTTLVLVAGAIRLGRRANRWLHEVPRVVRVLVHLGLLLSANESPVSWLIQTVLASDDLDLAALLPLPSVVLLVADWDRSVRTLRSGGGDHKGTARCNTRSSCALVNGL